MSNYIKASKAVGKSRYDRKVSEYQSSLTKKNLDDLSASLLSFSEIVYEDRIISLEVSLTSILTWKLII